MINCQNCRGLSAAAVAGGAKTVSDNSSKRTEPTLESAGAGLPGNGAALENADRERRKKLHSAAVADQAGHADQPDHADDVPDTNNGRGPMRRGASQSSPESKRAGWGNHAGGAPQHGGGKWWTAQPGLGGVVDGLPGWMDEPIGIPRISAGVKDRVNRLKCLGNAVVPQQFYPIFKAISEVEKFRTAIL